MKTAGNIILKSLFIVVLLSRGIFAAMAQDVPPAMPQPTKKEIPRITFKNLSPPFTDYAYFQGYQDYPFQVQMTAFSLIIFTIFYAPCFVTVVCIAKETGSWKWWIHQVAFLSPLSVGPLDRHGNNQCPLIS